MKVQHGGFEFQYNKKEKANMDTQESKIRSIPKMTATTTDEHSKFVTGTTLIIKTYFAWKIADRIVEKILR